MHTLSYFEMRFLNQWSVLNSKILIEVSSYKYPIFFFEFYSRISIQIMKALQALLIVGIVCLAKGKAADAVATVQEAPVPHQPIGNIVIGSENMIGTPRPEKQQPDAVEKDSEEHRHPKIVPDLVEKPRQKQPERKYKQSQGQQYIRVRSSPTYVASPARGSQWMSSISSLLGFQKVGSSPFASYSAPPHGFGQRRAAFGRIDNNGADKRDGKGDCKQCRGEGKGEGKGYGRYEKYTVKSQKLEEIKPDSQNQQRQEAPLKVVQKVETPAAPVEVVKPAQQAKA